MSVGLTSTGDAPPAAGMARPAAASWVVGYAIALALVAGAALLAFVVDHLIAAPNVTLVFVLPVVVAAARFGWGPALAATLAGVLVFDFFFTVPYYSLRIASASDVWAAALLLVIAAIVSTVAAQARRAALEAARVAARAAALHALAHEVVQAAPVAEVSRATAEAVGRIFDAPAAVLVRRGGRLETAGLSGGANLSAVDLEAAQWTLENRKPLHGGAYPFDASGFDFWPVCRDGAPEIVIGVGGLDRRADRPADAPRYVELAGAYLTASLMAPPHRQ